MFLRSLNMRARHVPGWLTGWPALSVALILLVCAFRLSAQPAPAGEYQIKAAYLFNFARFAEWPTNRLGGPDAPLVIGVLGADPFGDVLDRTVAGKTVGGHPLLIRRLKEGDDPRPCHLLFIARSETARLADILAQLGTTAALTVGESDSFLNAGGMIQFVIVEDTVKFEVNPAAAHRAGLQLNARLLSVAHAVRPAPAKSGD